MKVTKDMLLIDVFGMGDQQKIADALYGFNMRCLGCILAHGETVEQAAMSHNVPLDDMLDALNKACED